MANLRDAEQVTRRLAELAGDLRVEAARRDGSFGRMVEIADELGALADAFAATLARIDELLARGLAQSRPGDVVEAGPREDLTEALSPRHRGRSGSPWTDEDALTREELYARARAAGIPGRSRMSRDELIDALRARGAGD
jgi:hypothetical protein